MLYIFFCLDYAWRLISFLYYTKNTLFGEQISFRYIDINIQDFIDTGYRGNIIQGSVSFTDKDKLNCTEYIPGMYRSNNLALQWDSVKKREPTSDGFIQ